jgi:hypothetical protein
LQSSEHTVLGSTVCMMFNRQDDVGWHCHSCCVRGHTAAPGATLKHVAATHALQQLRLPMFNWLLP